MLCTSLLLFNFQRSSPPLSRRPFYYTTSLPVCQYLFQNFLKKFLKSFFRGISHSVFRGTALADSLYIILLLFSFVKPFFHFFLLFSRFRNILQFIYVILYDILGKRYTISPKHSSHPPNQGFSFCSRQAKKGTLLKSPAPAFHMLFCAS